MGGRGRWDDATWQNSAGTGHDADRTISDLAGDDATWENYPAGDEAAGQDDGSHVSWEKDPEWISWDETWAPPKTSAAKEDEAIRFQASQGLGLGFLRHSFFRAYVSTCTCR